MVRPNINSLQLFFSVIKIPNIFTVRICLLILFSVLVKSSVLQSQIILDEEPRRLYYERTQRVKKVKDFRNFRDVFHYDHFLLGKNRISGNISYNTGRVLISNGPPAHSEMRSAIGFYSRIRFLEEFSVNTTFYKDFNPKAAARWIADYSYCIGRYNWRPNRLNFGYENYINNKYSDNFKTFTEKFMEGYYFLSYNSPFPDKLLKKIRIDSTTSVKLTYFARYAFRYRDENDVVHRGMSSGKTTLGVSLRFTVIWNIYVESALYYYPEPSKRLPWDPDYSYGFGYFDWRSFRLSFTYGNWAINRFSWNKNGNPFPQYGFFDGNFRLVANWVW